MNPFKLFKKKVDPVTETQKQIRGNRAKSLLESEAYMEAMSDLEDGIWTQFFTTCADDPESRETLYTQITALKHVHEQLQATKLSGENSAYMEKYNNDLDK